MFGPRLSARIRRKAAGGESKHVLGPFRGLAVSLLQPLSRFGSEDPPLFEVYCIYNIKTDLGTGLSISDDGLVVLQRGHPARRGA